jgi:transcription elongation GreA/GreB family factor
MGKALIGRMEGDEVIVPRPKGAATFWVLAVSFERAVKS